MTIGRFRNLHLPQEVLKNQNGYKKILAEEFLDIQLLTKVEANLIGGNLENWKLIFTSERGKIYIFLNLPKSDQKLDKFEATSDFDRNKL